MCKTHYKYCIYLDNKKFYTVEIPKPEKPYIVLEAMKKSAEYSKILHFVTFHETSQVSVGRKKEIDIKISDDISISRHHANITYDFDNKTFLLEDNKSKFGTLVLIKRNLLINPFQRGISFQLGGELYAF
jgi:predicted component of type VI protein secretion system